MRCLFDSEELRELLSRWTHSVNRRFIAFKAKADLPEYQIVGCVQA